MKVFVQKRKVTLFFFKTRFSLFSECPRSVPMAHSPAAQATLTPKPTSSRFQAPLSPRLSTLAQPSMPQEASRFQFPNFPLRLTKASLWNFWVSNGSLIIQLFLTLVLSLTVTCTLCRPQPTLQAPEVHGPPSWEILRHFPFLGNRSAL